MKIECHVIQNFAPSCLNRDEANMPKECDFGGVRRARISSQSYKYAVKQYFVKENVVPVGKRSKLLKAQLLSTLPEALAATPPSGAPMGEAELPQIVDMFLRTYYSDLASDRPDETKVLISFSQTELESARDAIVTLLAEQNSDLRSTTQKYIAAKAKSTRGKKDGEEEEGDEETVVTGKIKQAKLPTLAKRKDIVEQLAKAKVSVDIALFGRMLAGNRPMEKDAACQVAHAISTHAATLEMDFYTAVDDLKPRDEVGAGMLGYTGFNSACLYRYALLDTTEFARNLGGDAALTKQGVEAFLWAFCNAEPSARQNSMPAHNRPSLVLFVAREKGVPTSLLNAFCRPVSLRGAEPDLIGDSVKRLTAHHACLGKVYEVWDGATQSLCHTLHERDDAEGLLGHLAEEDAGSLRKAIARVMGAF